VDSPPNSPAGARPAAVRVSLTLARPNMVLARPILDRDGRVAVGAGTALGPRVVQILRRLAIQSVPVVASDEISAWERIPEDHQIDAALAERFAREPQTLPMVALREAVRRCLERRVGRANEIGTPSGGDAAPAARMPGEVDG
jgi:hypothetical protein